MVKTELQSGKQRLQHGRACRRLLKRNDLSHWDGKKRTHDPIDVILASTYDRVANLIPIKMARMAASPFGFYRGSVPLMAADIALLPTTKIIVQICGDAHVRNLGAFEGPDGRLIFDVNDFDETIEGPWEWDVKRLATSLILAGREAGNSDPVNREAALEFARSYRQCIAALSRLRIVDAARYRVHRLFEGRTGATVLRKAEHCTADLILGRLTVARGRKRIFREHKPLLTRVPAATAKQVIDSLKAYRDSLPSERKHVLEFYRAEDVAFKVVGTGSVGTRDYVVLLFGNGFHDPLFLQVKEEPPSSYAPYLKTKLAGMNQGQRVVFGQRRLQTHSDILLGWTSIAGRDYLVRQLADHKASIDDQALKGKGLTHYGRTCGEVLAKGHVRSGDAMVLTGYLGISDKFDQALAAFAVRYADQTTKDYEAFKKAIRAGRIKAGNAHA